MFIPAKKKKKDFVEREYSINLVMKFLNVASIQPLVQPVEYALKK